MKRSSPPRSRLLSDRRGATIIEFAIIAPVLGLLLLGAFDTAHSLYMRATLQGIVQKVSRDSALESGATGAQQNALDNKVRTSVKAIANNAEIEFTRRFYRTFSSAAAALAEPFPAANDTNHNGICDNNEIFQDDNRNGVRDMDGGDSGQGGAKDRTLYTVSVSYPRFFPLYGIIGGSNMTRISAETVLQNQPYSDQGSYDGSLEGHCRPPPEPEPPTP
jgi:Flp pilus assembly pilin Flp